MTGVMRADRKEFLYRETLDVIPHNQYSLTEALLVFNF